ncbi:MAG TPA: His-Xaa-Ser system radical SAM maturase HxsC [Acidimicrobiales bacterium]|nr:His-Xaa-Ser system radical SAM maturase HxsC [Acidimicrobiales bacterium]
MPVGAVPVPGFGLYLAQPGTAQAAYLGLPVVALPPDLGHLRPGDVLHTNPNATRLSVLWKASARHNSLLLTERCDNYCLMCSQPPKEREDGWLYDRALRVIACTPEDAQTVCLTGGEPTLYPDRLLALLSECARLRPAMRVLLLSNGRRFADPAFARAYAALDQPGLMVGIPLYAGEEALHDYIVQARGAFTETVRGVLNLGALGQRIELRVVIQKHTVDHLAEIAEYICRNLPFVEQVALMGLEMTGFARSNHDEVWVDPYDYREQLASAALRLRAARINARIYNHQLCTLDRRLWPLSVKSISDWKNTYAEACQSCSVREQCGGVFSTSRGRVSEHIHAISEECENGVAVGADRRR